MLAVFFSACKEKNNQQQEDAVAYELMTINTVSHTLQTTYPAQIKGAQDIRIIPRVDGYLEKTLVKEGQRVKEGQLLFVIDQVAYRAAVKTAEASVLQAEAQVAKMQQEYESKMKLRENKIISEYDVLQTKRDLEIAKANLAAAKAELDIARNNLSFTELRSPSDGVVGKLPYRKGDYVSSSKQDGLTIVSDNQKVFVYFSLTEKRVMEYLSQYSSMQQAIDSMPALTLLLSGGTEYAEKGNVESVSGIVDESTGAVSVRAVFDNSKGLLLSGGTARVCMSQKLKDVIVIPQEATFETLNKIFVYRVENGVAKSRMVSVEALNNGKEYVVTDGLKPGDVIVAKGASFVREGTKVK